MFSHFIFQRIFFAANMIIDIFVYKENYVLPYYNTDINNKNKNNSCRRCLDGDMDSVFFV
jgi:hypothetical protein